MNSLYKQLFASFFCTYLLGGVLGPFISPMLLHIGYTHFETGSILAVLNFFAAIAPLWLGRLTDLHWPISTVLKLFGILVFACCLSLYLLVWIWPGPSIVFLGLLFLLYVAKAPALSLLDTLGLQAANQDAARYTWLRLTGSAGFTVAIMLGNLVFAYPSPRYFFAGVALVAMGGMLASFFLPQQASPQIASSLETSPSRGDFWASLDGPFYLWLAAVMLHWIAFSPYQYGLTLYLQEQHIPQEIYGFLWSLGVIAEVGFFAAAKFFFAHINIKAMLILAFFSSLLRWLLLGLFSQVWLIAATQLLHGPGFALYYMASMAYLAKRGPPFLSSYQGLFTTLVAGLSSCFGTALGGYLHKYHPFQMVFLYVLPIQGVSLLLIAIWPLGRFSYQSSPSSPSSEAESS